MNLETSQIAWRELQRFFANGTAIAVAQELDLVEVACQFGEDNKGLVTRWIEQDKLAKVSEQQALTWFEKDALVWAVVVKLWILIQDQA